MNNLNRFVVDIRTVDFSHFWFYMEAIDFVQDDTPWSSPDYWNKVVFKSFYETKAGKAYADQFNRTLRRTSRAPNGTTRKGDSPEAGKTAKGALTNQATKQK